MNTNYSLLPKCFVIICILGMGECGQVIYLSTHKLLDKKGLYTDEIENTVLSS